MKRITLTVLIVILLTSTLGVFAHGGRTDKNGGHRDKNNTSGLGHYHFHCGGYPAHLHNDNICPYKINPNPKETVPIHIIDAALSSHFRKLHIPKAILNKAKTDIIPPMFQLT